MVEGYDFKLLTAWYVANLIDKRVVFGIAGLSILLSVGYLLVLSWLSSGVANYTFTPPTGSGDRGTFAKWLVLLLASTVQILFFLLILVTFGRPGILDNFPRVDMTVSTNADVSANGTFSTGQTFVGLAKPSEEGTNEYEVTGSIETSGGELQNGQAVKPEHIDGLLLSHDAEYWYVLDDVGDGKGNIRSVALATASKIEITR